MSSLNKLLKKLVLLTFLIFSTNLLADNHDKNNTSKEEALPLNDPFVGDSSFSGGVKVITEGGAPSTERKRIDLYTYKLAGIIKSDSGSFISLINQDGEIITVAMYEEVSDGVKLVDMTTKEAVFETEEKYLIMNFKNQIKEQSEY